MMKFLVFDYFGDFLFDIFPELTQQVAGAMAGLSKRSGQMGLSRRCTSQSSRSRLWGCRMRCTRETRSPEGSETLT